MRLDPIVKAVVWAALGVWMAIAYLANFGQAGPHQDIVRP